MNSALALRVELARASEALYADLLRCDVSGTVGPAAVVERARELMAVCEKVIERELPIQ